MNDSIKRVGAIFVVTLSVMPLTFNAMAQSDGNVTSATEVTTAADSQVINAGESRVISAADGAIHISSDSEGTISIGSTSEQTDDSTASGEQGSLQDIDSLPMSTQDAEGALPVEPDTESAPLNETPAPVLPHDLSAWGMFMQADWVVKAVMIGLALASLATWVVLVAKTRELRQRTAVQRLALQKVSDASNLKEAYRALENERDALTYVHAAAQELKQSEKILADAEGVKERVASSLERLEAASTRAITRGTSILATIGSTAPFVGLFGTVWGIMNSFIGISKAQTTNLAVVAPGIAEALLATALGLVAAIPAVVIYNHFARQIATYKALVGDTTAAILRLVSRDLSRHAIAGKTDSREA